jgi:hypothetical protein
MVNNYLKKKQSIFERGLGLDSLAFLLDVKPFLCPQNGGHRAAFVPRGTTADGVQGIALPYRHKPIG